MTQEQGDREQQLDEIDSIAVTQSPQMGPHSFLCDDVCSQASSTAESPRDQDAQSHKMAMAMVWSLELGVRFYASASRGRVTGGGGGSRLGFVWPKNGLVRSTSVVEARPPRPASGRPRRQLR